jgi:hypothetical protein
MKYDILSLDYAQPSQSPIIGHNRGISFLNIVAIPTLDGIILTSDSLKQRDQIAIFHQPIENVGFDIPFTRLASRGENVTTQSASLAGEFRSLVEKWNEDTFAISSLTKIYAHPAYQRIMAMGTAGLPLVLRELQENQGNWFYALKFMAGKDGENVAAGIDNFEDAKAAWLEWGYRNNYI